MTTPVHAGHSSVRCAAVGLDVGRQLVAPARQAAGGPVWWDVRPVMFSLLIRGLRDPTGVVAGACRFPRWAKPDTLALRDTRLDSGPQPLVAREQHGGGLTVSIKWKTRRNCCFIAALLLGGASQDVLAQQTPPVELTRTVPTGKKRLVAFAANLNPDCSTVGEMDTRVIKQPQHGTVEVEPGSGFTNYPENNQRHGCNLKPSQGMRISYTSKEDFIGKDTFDVEILSGVGGDVIWKYTVTVK